MIAAAASGVAPAQHWQPIWELIVGTGYALAAGVVLRFDRRGTPGRLFALTAVLLLAAPLELLAGLPVVSQVSAVLATAVLIPLGLLRIGRGRAVPLVLRGLDAVVVLAGCGCVLATAGQAWSLAQLMAVGLAAALICAGWVQFELSAGDQRRQVLWVILAVAVAVTVGALVLVSADNTPISLPALAVTIGLLCLLVPASATIALLAPRAIDVRGVITHAVVLAVMATAVIATYSGGAAVLTLVTGTAPGRGAQALLAAVIAAAFHPTLVLVRASMDELLFGGRADPVDTLARLGDRLTEGSSPQDWLDTLRRALVVPAVVLTQGETTIATSGTVPAGATTMVTPLRTGTDHVGDLTVALGPDQLRLSAPTQAVLGLVAAPLAQALRAVALTEELRISRGHVVAALEEERRRVRRDLHDGLGPTLTGIAYSADAAVNLAGQDPDAAVTVLRRLRVDAGEAIAEVRRIVYGLRPKALDELGLLGAVRQRVSHLRGVAGVPLNVEVTADRELPELPAAVEVAAYRMVVEAVTNVARHAAVEGATVTFAVLSGTTLQVTVRDQGASGQPWVPGVGLTSMRERVEQIGGLLTVDGGPDGGTVTAVLPLGFAPRSG